MERSHRNVKRFWGVVLVAAAALIYAPTLSHELVWDDPILVAQVQQTLSEKGMAGLLRSEFLSATDGRSSYGYYRPVVLASLALDSRLSSAWPFSFHLTNVLLHVLNAVLVLLLLRSVSCSGPAAVVGGLLFALHPVHVESVAFVSGRTDLWAAFFALLAALCWFLDRPSAPRRSMLLRAGGALALIAAGLSKESALLLPFLLVAMEPLLGPGGGANPTASPHSRIRSWAIPWAAALAVILLLRWEAGVSWGLRSPILSPTSVAFTGEGFVLMLERLALYMRLLVLPWPLNAYYTPDQVVATPATLAAALLLLAAGLAPHARRPRLPGAPGLFWTVGFLIPVLGFFPISSAAVAERYLYLPSVGLCLLTAALVDRLPSKGTAVVAASIAGCVIFLSLGAATAARSRIWRDRRSLYADLVRTSPNYAPAHYNLGNVELDAGRYREAAEAYRRALRIEPGYVEALFNLGLALQNLGDIAGATRAFRQTIHLRPDMAEPYYRLGSLAIKSRDYGEALSAYRSALQRDPASPEGHYNLGLLYKILSRPEEAAQAFREAIRLRPDYPRARSQLETLEARP